MSQSKPLFSQLTRNILGIVVLVLALAVALLVVVPTAQSRAHEGQARAVAEKLAAADANGDLYRHPERYADICGASLQAKLQLQSVQAIPQMDALGLKSTLLGLDGSEVERQDDGYVVRVRATVRIEGQAMAPQDMSGVAIVAVSRFDDQWLASDYLSFTEE